MNMLNTLDDAESPRVQEVTGTVDIDLSPPPGFRMSVLLNLVAAGAGYYTTWNAMLVKRGASNGNSFRCSAGSRVLRLDIPAGLPLSADALAPHVRAYFAQQQLTAESPIVRD